jgi:hypothetical protein
MDDQVILLDLYNGQYFALDHEFLVEFRKITLAPSSYNFEEQLSKKSQLLEQLNDMGFFSTNDLAIPRIKKNVVESSLISAFFSLVHFRMKLWDRSLEEIYERCRIYRHQTSTPRTINDLKEALLHIMRVESLLPCKRAFEDCLFRSLLIFYHLKRSGFQPHHMIGVRLHPFSAHAWTTALGVNCLDSSQRLEQFTVISEYN